MDRSKTEAALALANAKLAAIDEEINRQRELVRWMSARGRDYTEPEIALIDLERQRRVHVRNRDRLLLLGAR